MKQYLTLDQWLEATNFYLLPIGNVFSPMWSLPDQGLVVQVPDGDVPIAAAGEAHLGVRGDGQGIAGRG